MIAFIDDLGEPPQWFGDEQWGSRGLDQHAQDVLVVGDMRLADTEVDGRGVCGGEKPGCQRSICAIEDGYHGASRLVGNDRAVRVTDRGEVPDLVVTNDHAPRKGHTAP